MSIYKECDIRGIYEKEFDSLEIYRIGLALGSILKGKDIVVAGDVRISTPQIKEELIKGLYEAGTKIIDIGIAPTPVAYFAKDMLNAYALAIVTASHNPAEYNGIKIMIGDEPPTHEEILEIGKLANGKTIPKSKECFDVIDKSKEVLEEYLKTMPKLAGQGHSKVVLDMGNGTTSQIAPALYRACGYEVIELFGEPDGSFPNRNPNPANFDNITMLCKKVVEEKADFGVAFDGDGDRAVFVDDLGRPVINEKILIFLFERAASEVGSKVVYDQKCSQILPKTIENMGGKAILERSGHAFIKKRFLKEKAILAGEISGHFFFEELKHDDGMYAGLALGAFLGFVKRPLSVLVNEIPDPHISPDLRFKVKYEQMEGIFEHIEDEYRDYPISNYDGVRVELPDGWFLVRKSVTEEAMTLKIEAISDEKLAQIKEQLVSKYFK